MALINTAKREKEGSQKLPTRYYSKRQEDAVAKKFSGNRVKGSGSTPWQKGDVHDKDYCFKVDEHSKRVVRKEC